MKLNSLLSSEPTIAGVNIVPVIDLCLVLLIILMVTSPLLDTADLPVKLPQARTIESKDRNISITYSTDGRYALNSDIVDEKALIPEIRKIIRVEPDMLVIIRVDRSAPYSVLVDLISKCKKAGATSISIGTEQTKVNG